MSVLAFIKKTTLKSICDAVREKIGESKTYLPSELPSKIRSIKTGSDVSGVTASPADVRRTKKYVDNQGVLRQGTMSEYPGKTILPDTGTYVISAGQYLAGSLTILGDSDLLSKNIKKGVTIFGVDGTLEESFSSNNFTVTVSGVNLTINIPHVNKIKTCGFYFKNGNGNTTAVTYNPDNDTFYVLSEHEYGNYCSWYSSGDLDNITIQLPSSGFGNGSSFVNGSITYTLL